MISKLGKAGLAGGRRRRAASTAAAAAAPPAHPNQQELNDHLSGLCKRGLHEEALRAFHRARRRSPAAPPLFRSTYARLAMACAATGSLTDGLDLRRHLARSGTAPDLILHNHLLTMLGKCGAPDEARALFDEMPTRNLVSWTSLLAGLSRNGRHREAAALFPEILRRGFLLDEFAVEAALRAAAAAGDAALGGQLHAVAAKCAAAVPSALISMYCSSGQVPAAAAIFSGAQRKDLVTWGTMVAGFSQQGRHVQSLETFRSMLSQEDAPPPNEFLFGSAFTACGALAALRHGEELHGLCVKLALSGDACAGAAAAAMYAKCGDLGAAMKAFRCVRRPDTAAWNAAIGAQAYAGEFDAAMELFKEMLASGCRPDDLTLLCLLCNVGPRPSQGQLLHGQALKLGLLSNLPVSNALLAMYCRCCMGHAPVSRLFGEMKDLDLVSWNTAMSACVERKQMEEALCVLSRLAAAGHRPDRITLGLALAAASALGYLATTRRVHGWAMKSGLEEDEELSSRLVDAYCKCGSAAEARRLPLRGSAAWTSLVLGHAQSGCGREALELFKDMVRHGAAPTGVTFLGVLAGCSRAGLVEEGWRVFEAMKVVHGVEPGREHYSCMVDLLARAGWVKEAEEVLQKTPLEADAVGWKTVLAAWRRRRGERGAAERAAGKVLELEPGNSAAMAMLCDVYATEGRWEEVAGVRRAMRQAEVVRSPGKSWIEVGGEVRVFLVEDRTHPETMSIYHLLSILRKEMSRQQDNTNEDYFV
ncbi:tetratricopeptide repeat (TPR)-like superfamily protein [Wolffia australiana]